LHFKKFLATFYELKITSCLRSIYLVDHAWTFRPEMARQQLEQVPGLLSRMSQLFELESSDQDDKDQLIDEIMDIKWKFAQTYRYGI
jgi:tubulin--tyrosine ligase-like protein 12